ncbi:MAG: ATP-binding protein [Bacteroidota bacterium]
MKVLKYVKKDAPRILINAPVTLVYEKLHCGSCFIVEDEQENVLGVISHADLCLPQKLSIRDILTTKPELTSKENVEDALVSMSAFGTDCLPVYEDGKFLGVVFQHDIALGLVNKMNRQSRVYRNMVHDLRTSINNISGLNTLLSQNVTKKENVELVELSAHVADHSLHILDDLQSNDTLEHVVETVSTDVPRFVEECAEEMKGRAFSKKIDFIYKITRNEFIFDLQPTKFKRVIQNLLSNAIKFTHKGGTVTTYVGIAKDACMIEIRDTGVGIPLDEQHYILQSPAVVSKIGTDGEQSSGLGLQYVKSSVKQMGAELNFTSTEGEGSTFHIILKRKQSRLL